MADQIPIEPSKDWSIAKRITFRFAFAYSVLLLASFAGILAPLTMPIVLVSQALWTSLVRLTANHILDIPVPPLNSDGDGVGYWIMVWGCVVLSAFGTVLWSILDRSRKEYATLHNWLQVILRYSLGVTMISYGLVKIFHLQMLPLHLAKLVQPYGDSSPTSLLWIFMGSSAAYSAFTGFVETLSGVLLFNRRTALLGTLLTIASMAHVVALNLSYDVSVKIWSMNLLVLSIILLSPDIRRLTNIFILNRPHPPVTFRPLFPKPKTNRIMFRIGMACLAITIGLRLFGLVNGRAKSYSRTPVPLWGIHEVETFSSNDVSRPPLLSDTSRWRMLIIERSGLASIRLMDDSILDYLTNIDAENSTITFVKNPDESITTAGGTRQAYNPKQIENRFERAINQNADAGITLDFKKPTDLDLKLFGQWEGEEIEVQLKRKDETDFLLLNRGFHWIQEYPFFR